ncbi:MAG: PBP1A family penicillin-binding protein [Gemmatimonadota bacterium]
MDWGTWKSHLRIRGEVWRARSAALRARCTRRRVVVGLLAAGTFATTLIVVEALVRGHLVPPEDRVPTGLYTRSVAWNGDAHSALLIGSVVGAPAEWRVPVALGEMPDHLIDAVLAIEDKRFRQHSGIDLRRIGGAMVANIRAGGIAEGGSTITQQLAKNLFLSAHRTPLRKLREAALALVLESRYPKAQILEAYLNEIYLGQDQGIALHGVGAAAHYYFGKDVSELSLAESATLAGMIHSPNRLAPTRHPADAAARRDLVIALMQDQGRIDDEAARHATQGRVRARPHPSRTLDARYFRDAVGTDVAQGLPDRGAAVYTTLDASLQLAAERAIAAGLASLGQAGAQGALVAIDPRTGDVLAMVGGRDYGASQFNRAVDAHRQPGSAFKPIVALAALERMGGGDTPPAFTLASHVADAPLSVPTREGTWRPANYDGDFRGDVTLREALEQSRNVPFARIGLAIGPERIVAAASRLGITSTLQPVPALALGSGEVTLLELVRAYGVFANAGELAASRMVLATRVGRGELRERDPAHISRVADPAAAYLVTSALEGAVDHGTGAALQSYRFAGAIAGKTGTSNDWRDAWFVAYTPTLVVGVWVGHDDGASLHRTGAQAALPIVARFLGEADLDDERFEEPEGIVEEWVGTGQGGWLSRCDQREVFLLGTEPEAQDCVHFDPDDWDLHIDVDREQLDDWKRTIRDGAESWLREQIAARLRSLVDR